MLTAEYRDDHRVRHRREEPGIRVLARVCRIDSILVGGFDDEVGVPDLGHQCGYRVGSDAWLQPSHYSYSVLLHPRDSAAKRYRHIVGTQRHPHEPRVQARRLYRYRILLVVRQSDTPRCVDVLPRRDPPTHDHHHLVFLLQRPRYDIRVALDDIGIWWRAENRATQTHDDLQASPKTETMVIQHNDSSYKAVMGPILVRDSNLSLV